MADYRAPIRDLRFVFQEVLDPEIVRGLPGYEEFEADTVNAVLQEAGRFAGAVLAPLNVPGDRQGLRLADGRITTPDGFADAYRQFVEAGWNSVTGAPDYGGMGMPTLLGSACHELWNAANMSFALCPLLTASAISLLAAHGSQAQKQTYLGKMISGQWTGVMDLTEPQAGSDLGGVRTRAVADEEAEGDAYRLFGQKIYITWGEHDMAANIVHLVLARLPDAPAGVKGISLFVVPKFLPDADGNPGQRNDMRCPAIEHKLGIHASPTCTITYGDNGDGALGTLVGEPGRGLAHMFVMMNAARHKMGLQALGLSDRAYQQALAYARERVQGKPIDPDAPEGAAIVYHPDVRRMLLGMKCRIEAMRALCLDVAAGMDVAERHPDDDARKAAQARVDLLIPVVKAWCTEQAMEITSQGIQVHGGMGFVEETGAAQYLRDARIIPIYEGTNGIQANDLVGRKLLRDGGAAMDALLADMRTTVDTLAQTDGELLPWLGQALGEAVDALQQATDTLLDAGREQPGQALANAFNYTMLTGFVVGGWYQMRMALAAQTALDNGPEDPDFYRAKLTGARFYAAQVLPRAHGYARSIAVGHAPVLAADPARDL